MLAFLLYLMLLLSVLPVMDWAILSGTFVREEDGHGRSAINSCATVGSEWIGFICGDEPQLRTSSDRLQFPAYWWQEVADLSGQECGIPQLYALLFA